MQQGLKGMPSGGRLRAACESAGNMWIKTYDEFERGDMPITPANP